MLSAGSFIYISKKEPFAPSPKVKSAGTSGANSKSCEGTGTVTFTSPPMRLKEIGHILPIGLLNGEHVTPTDHGYYHPPNWRPQEAENPTKFKDVLSPADGILAHIELVRGTPGDYRLTINHTCTLYTIYIHVRELSPRILQMIGPVKRHMYPNIKLGAGEVIGRSNGFDFSVHNKEFKLSGFVIPEHYSQEPWKIHTVDMFGNFPEPMRSQLLAKNVRQRNPRGGKIDYDIDGRLVGNWFVENTGGYTGNSPSGNYWNRHLSFAYDAYDPSAVIVSMGNFNGGAKQFGVKGNSPNPSTISVASGLVKYELVSVEYLTEEGNWWNRTSFAKVSKAVGGDKITGVILVQMVENRKIKFESFPGKTATEVRGFTTNAVIYER